MAKSNFGPIIIGIIIVALFLYNQNKVEEEGIGLKIHYYIDGVEVFPQERFFSIVTPDGGSYNQIAFDISVSNIGDVGLENFKIVDASPLAFKNSLPAVGSIIGGGAEITSTEDFETGSLVNWNQVAGDDMDWTIKTGATSSSNTGPTSAYEGSYYAYTEASSAGSPSKTSILESNEFAIGSTSEITFNYHMYGSNMGTLYLEAATSPYSSWSEIWSATGDLGNVWNTRTSSLNSYSGQTIKLRFRGVTGLNWDSDMAIDNLRVINFATGSFTLPTGNSGILLTSNQMATDQFEAISPVNFWIELSWENTFTGEAIYPDRAYSGDVVFEAEGPSATQSFFSELFSVVDIGGVTYHEDRGAPRMAPDVPIVVTDYTGSGYFTGFDSTSSAGHSWKLFIDGTEVVSETGLQSWGPSSNTGESITEFHNIIRFENSLLVQIIHDGDYAQNTEVYYSVSYMTD